MELATSERVLLVSGVTGGLIAQWNEENPMMEVRRGDEIVEVNGACGDFAELQEELDKPIRLDIRLKRKQANKEKLDRSSQKKRIISHSKSRLFKGISDPSLEPGFLMDMVNDIPESQAKRTLRNASDEGERNFGEEFELESLERDLQDILQRASTSIHCAAWVNHKLTEHHEAEATAMKVDEYQEPAAAPPDSTLSAEPLRDHLAEVKAVAGERTSDLAEDVASVLGEEMQGLERRQREQQRAMTHTQESLQGLRQTVYKLSQTCEEVGNLADQLSKEGGHRKRTAG